MSSAAPALVLADEEVLPSEPGLNKSEMLASAAGDVAERQSHGPASVSVLYPLTRLANRPLARAIVVTVEGDGDSVIMSSQKLRVWGIGADVYEALSDFSTTIQEVYDSYSHTPQDQLTPRAIEYFHELQSYLIA